MSERQDLYDMLLIIVQSNCLLVLALHNVAVHYCALHKAINKLSLLHSSIKYYTCFLSDHTPQRRSVADKMSPMRLLGASSREDSLNEINRKMQRALEETLTKNIHLQEVGISVYMHLCVLAQNSDRTNGPCVCTFAFMIISYMYTLYMYV